MITRLFSILVVILSAFLAACAPSSEQLASAPATSTNAPTDLPTMPPTTTPTVPPTASATHTPLPSDTPTTAPTATETPVPTSGSTRTPQPTATPLPNSVLQISLDFSPDGAVYATGGETILAYRDARFQLLQATDGVVVADFELPSKVIAFEIAVNSPLLAAAVVNADGGSDIELYDITSGDLLVTIPNASRTAVSGLRFSGDETTLITTSPEGAVRVWNVADGADQGSFTAHKDQVTCMAIAPDGQTIATGSFAADNNVNAWTTGGELVNTLTSTNEHCYWIVFSPDNAWVFYQARAKMSLYSTADWSRAWFETFSGSTSSKINFPERNALVGFTPEGELYFAARTGTVEVVNTADLTPIETLEVGSFVTINFSPNGQAVAVARSNQMIEILDLNQVP